MSKVSLKILEQKAASVESCVKDVEYAAATEKQQDIAEELRGNWDLLYTTLLDFHEILCDLLGEIER